MNEYCESYKECYDLYALTLWRIIMTNKYRSISLIGINYFYYIFTGLLVFYNQKMLSNDDTENTFIFIKIITRTIAVSYYFLPIINVLSLYINHRIFDLTMVRTVLFAQVVTFPLYYLGYSHTFKIKSKYKQFPYNFVLLFGIFIIYVILFIIYLFTISEYVTIA